MPQWLSSRAIPNTSAESLGPSTIKNSALISAGTASFPSLARSKIFGRRLPAKTCSIVTQEAFETYWQHLDPNDGIIAVQASSRHINLFPVLQGLCAYFHADAAIVDVNTAQDPFETSYWVLRSEEHTSELQSRQ